VTLMKGALPSILSAVGRTPIVKLVRIGAALPVSLYVKCEFLSPGGSSKDRMVLRVIEEAERRGELKAGATIVEATSGNTGASLAMVAAVRGYKCVFVVPDKTSTEKIRSLKAYGAKVVVCPTALEEGDPRSMFQVARRIATETPNAFFANQYGNPDNAAGHYHSTGPEVWDQTGGEIDVLVANLGTGGTLGGAGAFLKEKKPSLVVVGVDAIGSSDYAHVKSGRKSRPPASDAVIDEIVRVDDKECFLTARELVRLEGIGAGGSSGTALAGALKWASQHTPPGHRKPNVVVLLPDGSGKYLSTIFDDDWMREHGFLETSGLGVVRDLLKTKSDEIITAHPTDRVRDVIARMKAHGISQLPVVEDGTLHGAVAEVDLLRYLVSGEHSLDSAVGPLAESDYATVSPQTTIEHLQGLLSDARMAVVLDGAPGPSARIAGVVTKIDLIDYLARRA
jgi:cystathionine beta-synthase